MGACSVALAGLVVAACGPSSPAASSAQVKLRADASAIRAAAVRQDLPAAEAALRRLRSDLARFVSLNELSATTAYGVLEAAQQVQASLPLISSTTSSTTTTTTSTTTSTSTTTTTTTQPGSDKKHHHNGN